MSQSEQYQLVSQIMRDNVAGQVQALQALEARINGSFSEALELLAECRGRAILFGMKQSGLIGQKIASALYDTGLSTHLLNPADTRQDNLNMIGQGDVIIMLSYSGKTEELIRLYPLIQKMGNKVIVITGDPLGPVAQQANIVLDASVEKVRDNRELAPTTYTTVLLAIGDLLAEALIRRRVHSSPQAQGSDQKMEWVRDIVHRGPFASVSPESTLKDVMQSMTQNRTNISLVMEGDILCGIITDGDLRRNLAGVESLKGISARSIMNASPVCIQENASAAEARAIMNKEHLHSLVVKDRNFQVVGLISREDQ